MYILLVNILELENIEDQNLVLFLALGWFYSRSARSPAGYALPEIGYLNKFLKYTIELYPVLFGTAHRFN